MSEQLCLMSVESRGYQCVVTTGQYVGKYVAFFTIDLCWDPTVNR